MITIILSVAVIVIGTAAIGLLAKRAGAFDYEEPEHLSDHGHRDILQAESVAVVRSHRAGRVASI